MVQYIDPNKRITIRIVDGDYVINDDRDPDRSIYISVDKITKEILEARKHINIHDYGTANGLTWEQSHCFLRYVIKQINLIA